MIVSFWWFRAGRGKHSNVVINIFISAPSILIYSIETQSKTAFSIFYILELLFCFICWRTRYLNKKSASGKLFLLIIEHVKENKLRNRRTIKQTQAIIQTD